MLFRSDARVRARLASDPAARSLLRACEASFGELADDGTAPPPMTHQAARTRLLLEAEPRPRGASLVDALSRFLGFTADATRGVLRLLEDAAVWTPTPLPGVNLCDFDGGAANPGARTGLVRLAPSEIGRAHV